MARNRVCFVAPAATTPALLLQLVAGPEQKSDAGQVGQRRDPTFVDPEAWRTSSETSGLARPLAASVQASDAHLWRHEQVHRDAGVETRIRARAGILRGTGS